MTIGARLLACLQQAGPGGCSTTELATALYGESSYTELGRVSVLVGTLRRKGHSIHTQIDFDGKTRTARYIFAAYLVTAVEARKARKT